LTSWRSGRRGGIPRGREIGTAASCAEDGASGGCWCGDGLTGPDRGCQDGFGSPNSNKSARGRAWPSHAAPVSSERIRSARTGAILRNHILRNHRDSFGSPDTSVSTTTLRCRFGGEFDPGSGSTLAACLMHASRARTLSGVLRGGRVRNTWATCPGVGDSRGKPRVIPHTFGSRAEI
jgi:hypothetical protein